MGYFKEKNQNLIKKKKEEEMRNFIFDTFHPFFSVHIKL
jgi:hypothetical protein